jgi:uncharacterized repeat protein (TIGR01451 family)
LRAFLVAAAISGFLAAMFYVAPARSPVRAVDPVPLDGSTANCGHFALSFLGFELTQFPEPGWVWVNPADRYRDVAGLVTESHVTHTDFPTVHDSHDQNTAILVDPEFLGVVSDANHPGEIENEWEIGTFPEETGSDPERLFPKWAWPNIGDRVWMNGNWIFDCGHPTDIGGEDHFKSEIHPPRASAAMRPHVRPLPGTGTTPVPVTETDLYIHGRSGFVMDDLTCGQNVIVGDGSCDAEPYPHRGTPIDTDYSFDIQLPPKPVPSAVAVTVVEDGPGNTLGVAPVLTPVGDGSTFHVSVPLAGTGATPDDVYARKIFSGWIYPPEDLHHIKLTLNKMDLHDDRDTDPGDCECSFFWMNVDKASNSWIRLSTFATGNMNDYDDDDGFGDGEMGFSGAVFDFYVANGDPFAVWANGYDQDCLDERFGNHSLGTTVGGVVIPGLEAFALADCYINPIRIAAGTNGDNSKYPNLETSFTAAAGYGAGNQDVSAGDYELEFNITDEPLTVEDSADLALDKICKPDNVVDAGKPITCSIVVDNPGPGLPRNVVVRDTLFTDAPSGSYTMGPATFVFEGFPGSPNPCVSAPPNQFTCNLGTVPVGGRAIISVAITATEGGDFNNEARVSSESSDSNTANNRDIDGVTVRPVADLQVTKAGPATGIAGENLTYDLEVTNLGPSTATNVRIDDILPVGVSIGSVTAPGGSCNAGVPGNAFLPTYCTFGSLGPSSAQTMQIVAHVAPDVLGPLNNDVRTSSETFDPNNSNNSGTRQTVISDKANLTITKSAAPAPSVIAGQGLTYTIAITNNGPSVARNVDLSDTLPSAVSLTSWSISSGSGSCTLLAPPPNNVECSLGTLGLGQTIRVFLNTTVATSTPDAATLTNSATVTTSATDPSLPNTASVSTTVAARGDLGIVKSADFDTYKPSSTVRYTITVTNNGSSDALGVSVTDDLPTTKQANYVFDSGGCTKSGLTLTCPHGTLAAGASYSFNVYVTIKGSKGAVFNTASVSSATADPDLSNNSSTEVVLIGK